MSLRSRPRREGDRDFQPFDGTQPLLPQWNPSSAEEAFQYHGARARARERAAEEMKPVVCVTAGDDEKDVLFAEIVKRGVQGDRVWLRPLMMRRRDADSLLDMRATSDLVLPETFVQTPDDKDRIVVLMSVAAWEKDLLQRCISEEDGLDSRRQILTAFVNRLDFSSQD